MVVTTLMLVDVIVWHPFTWHDRLAPYHHTSRGLARNCIDWLWSLCTSALRVINVISRDMMPTAFKRNWYRLLTVPWSSIVENKWHYGLHCWPLIRGIQRWIPYTKGQQCGKRFRDMWRHHAKQWGRAQQIRVNMNVYISLRDDVFRCLPRLVSKHTRVYITW